MIAVFPQLLTSFSLNLEVHFCTNIFTVKIKVVLCFSSKIVFIFRHQQEQLVAYTIQWNYCPTPSMYSSDQSFKPCIMFLYLDTNRGTYTTDHTQQQQQWGNCSSCRRNRAITTATSSKQSGRGTWGHTAGTRPASKERGKQRQGRGHPTRHQIMERYRR